MREDVKSTLWSPLKRLLNKHGYPSDEQPAAIKAVIVQMEAIAPRMGA